MKPKPKRIRVRNPRPKRPHPPMPERDERGRFLPGVDMEALLDFEPEALRLPPPPALRGKGTRNDHSPPVLKLRVGGMVAIVNGKGEIVASMEAEPAWAHPMHGSRHGGAD